MIKLLLYIFNSNKIFLGIFFAFCLIFTSSIVADYIIKNSNHRLSKIYSSQSINDSSIFFIGNSRSVPFNFKNLENSNKILNLAHNSMNSFEVENIIKAIKKKNTKKKTIYIELTSLADDSIQCSYSIFYDLNFYYGKKNIQKNCKQQFYLNKFTRISKINDELFYRILYYFVFPEEDQLWTNNYTMPKATCTNPKTPDLIKHFFSEDSEIKIYEKSNSLTRMYSDANTEIFFFISPVYQKINFALNTEIKFVKKKLKNLIRLNTLLDKKFFENCNMFTDTLHLSSKGVAVIKKIALSNL